LLQFVTHFPPRRWHNSAVPRIYEFRIADHAKTAEPAECARGQPSSRPPADNRLRARTAEEERELALLAQFMRHDSVASLAKAIAARSGGSMRAGDLIAAAGLGPNRRES
jgi:hypothetical protein